MLLRFDPFRDLDRLAEAAGGRPPRPFPMDAVRRGDDVVISFELPGVATESIDLTVERNELTVRADIPDPRREGDDVLASERRYGSISRQLILGDTLDTDRVEADYRDGVLVVTIPAAETAKPRKVAVSAATDGAKPAIETSAGTSSAA
jgi:HSP20 family protein